MAIQLLGKDSKVGAPIILCSAELAAKGVEVSGYIPLFSSKRKIGREEIIIIGRMAPVRVIRAGKTTVLVAVEKGLPSLGELDHRGALERFELGLVDEWRSGKLHIPVRGQMVVFARDDPDKAIPVTIPGDEVRILRGHARLQIRLYPHRSVTVDYHVFALGAEPEGPFERPADEPSEPLRVTAAQEKHAEKASFLRAVFGHMMIIGASRVDAWDGQPSVKAKGPRPYHAVQKVGPAGVAAVEGGDVVAMDPHEAVGLLETDDGLLLTAWRGAAGETACVLIALTLPDEYWKPVGRYRADEREVVMFDSGVAGRKLDSWDRVTGKLPATGTYSVEHCELHSAVVQRTNGQLEEANIAAVRLRKV